VPRKKKPKPRFFEKMNTYIQEIMPDNLVLQLRAVAGERDSLEVKDNWFEEFVLIKELPTKVTDLGFLYVPGGIVLSGEEIIKSVVEVMGDQEHVYMYAVYFDKRRNITLLSLSHTFLLTVDVKRKFNLV